MKTKSLILIMLFMGFIVTSCQKTKPLEESSIEAADDAVLSEAVFDDAFATLEIATAIAEDLKKSATVVDTCPVITVNFPGQDLWPCNIVIDYGTGCEGLNDIVRSGKIIITLSAPRREVASVRTITFEDYYFNDAKVEGTKTVTNLGPNNDGNVVFSDVLAGGMITFPDSKTIVREVDREREYIAGYASWTPWDDECLITGVAAGTNLDGKMYTHTIINPLHWKAACRFIVSGTIGFEIEGVEPFKLDYGDGECDAYATLIRGDDSREIILRFRHPKYSVGK
jgi:uncharacterized repeat protein (TIGR01451 family)